MSTFITHLLFFFLHILFSAVYFCANLSRIMFADIVSVCLPECIEMRLYRPTAPSSTQWLLRKSKKTTNEDIAQLALVLLLVLFCYYASAP